jgi:hypothetical protein
MPPKGSSKNAQAPGYRFMVRKLSYAIDKPTLTQFPVLNERTIENNAVLMSTTISSVIEEGRSQAHRPLNVLSIPLTVPGMRSDLERSEWNHIYLDLAIILTFSSPGCWTRIPTAGMLRTTTQKRSSAMSHPRLNGGVWCLYPEVCTLHISMPMDSARP